MDQTNEKKKATTEKRKIAKNSVAVETKLLRKPGPSLPTLQPLKCFLTSSTFTLAYSSNGLIVIFMVWMRESVRERYRKREKDIQRESEIDR